MAWQWPRYLIFAILAVILAGCASLQPSSFLRPSDTQLPWKNYEDAKEAAEKIIAGKTTFAELRNLGFDPLKIPNTQKMVDVRKELLPNQSSTIEELPPGAQLCYKKGLKCEGYRFQMTVTKSEGKGSTIMRLIGMKKEVLTTGWAFQLDVYLLDRSEVDLVAESDPKSREKVIVFGLHGGTPNINNIVTDKNPLGLINTLIGIGGQFSPIRPPQLDMR